MYAKLSKWKKTKSKEKKMQTKKQQQQQFQYGNVGPAGLCEVEQHKLFGSRRNDPSQKLPPDTTQPPLPLTSPPAQTIWQVFQVLVVMQLADSYQGHN